MDLFANFRLGNLALPNRIVMAPMTRSRALANLSNALMAEYYAQRAAAGLIITEGVAPAPNGLGYARIPGLFSREQVEAFRGLTRSVHDAGGRIIAQIMHVGRIAHPLNMPEGARILAPSAVQPAGTMYTDQAGLQPYPTPHAMVDSELKQTREEFVQAAKNAVASGFDGVELHGANGYLLEQFLHPHTNRRTDGYGGEDPEQRNRFVLEVAGAVADAIAPERVAVRLSPHSTLGDLPSYDGVAAQYSSLAKALRGLLYVHLAANAHPDFASTAGAIQAAFAGPLILNGDFDQSRAQRALAAGDADLIAFGRPFIANPDLVERMRRGLALAEPDLTTLYTAGARGYIDYPRAA